MFGILALLKLGSIWSRLGAAISGACSAVAGWVMRNPIPALIGALVLVIAVLLLCMHIERGEVTAAKSTVAKVVSAQAAATAAQIQVNQAPAVDSAAIARQSDAQAPAYYTAVGAAADAHASVVRGTCPASQIGNANLPRPDPVAPLDDGPTGVAIVVSRPKTDDDQLVAAAGRAAQMHQDALALIARGDAVADESPTHAPTEGN